MYDVDCKQAGPSLEHGEIKILTISQGGVQLCLADCGRVSMGRPVLNLKLEWTQPRRDSNRNGHNLEET